MLERNKSYEMKEWFAAKVGKENNFSLMDGWLVAIMKETEKAVYAMVHISGSHRKCMWVPKSCLEEYEIGNDGFCNHYETVIEPDYAKCCEIFQDHCFMYDLYN
jgi:hypothetical protein